MGSAGLLGVERSDTYSPDACVSAEAESMRRAHGVRDAGPDGPIPLPPRKPG